MWQAGLIDQIAAFVTDNQEAAVRRAVQCPSGAGGLTCNKRRSGGIDRVIQRLGADRAQQHVYTIQLTCVGPLHQRGPVFTVTQIDQRIFQAHTFIFGGARVGGLQDNLTKVIQ